MQEFLHIALSFPTVLWSVLLTVTCAYWLFVIVGALDLEFLDAHLDLDLDVDMDVDVDVDVAEPGLALSGVEGGDISLLSKAAVSLGLGKVPLTVLLSILSIVGWSLSYFTVLYLPLASDGIIARSLTMAIVLAVAFPVMGVLAHPLKGVFTTSTRREGTDLIGQTCEITTGSVTATFGQARIAASGAVLVLAVRCDTPNALKRRDNALIIGYDSTNRTYSVEPYEQFLNNTTDNTVHAATEPHTVDTKQEV